MSGSTKFTSRKLTLSYFGLIVLFCSVASAFFVPSAKSAGIFAPGTSAPESPAPTPTKKTALPAANKPAAKPASTQAPKQAATSNAETSKVIVNTTSARVRSEATTSSTELRRMKLGTVLSTLEKTSGAAPWYKVQLPAGPKTSAGTSTGWMSSTVVSDFDPAKAETVYRQITTKNFKKTGMSFTDGAEIYEFLSDVISEVKNNEAAADLGLKRLQALTSALSAIPIMKSEDSPYKDFTKAHEEDIVYSDPAGQWFVRAELFWDLRKKHAKSTLADEIAWAAARTFLPGECEGYVNCYLYLMRQTDGEYLTLHPNGKHSLEALKNITTYLQPIVADIKEKKVYTGPSDLSDRAEYNKLLSELRNVISRLPHVDKDKPLRQITQLAEAYK